MSNPISARLRDRKNSAILGGEMPDPLYATAADHIDAQDATIKALTEALGTTRQILSLCRERLVILENDPKVIKSIAGTIEKADAALAAAKDLK